MPFTFDDLKKENSSMINEKNIIEQPTGAFDRLKADQSMQQEAPIQTPQTPSVQLTSEQRMKNRINSQEQAIKAQKQSDYANSAEGKSLNFLKSLITVPGEFALNTIASAEKGFGESIGQGINVKLYQEEADRNNKLYIKTGDNFMKLAKNTLDTKKKEQYINQAQKAYEMAGIGLQDIVGKLKTPGQVIGEAAGVALDIATAGQYGQAVKGATTGARFIPEATKAVPTILTKLSSEGLKEAGKKALVGGGIGYGMDVAYNMQQGKEGVEALTPGFATILGVGLPAIGYAYGAGKELVKGAPLSDIVKKGYEKGVRPTVVGKRNANQMNKAINQQADGVQAIINYKDKLSFEDNATGNIVNGKLPEDLEEFSSAISQVKKEIFNEYDAMQIQASKRNPLTGMKPKVVKFDGIVSDLESTASNKVLQLQDPTAAKYAQDLADRFKEKGSFTPTEAQEFIKRANDDLKSFYRNPSFGNATRAEIDAKTASYMRKELDSLIENEVGPGYQKLKNMYGALGSLEKEVSHRAIVDARKNNRGLADLVDIFNYKDIAVSAMTGNPALAASSLTGKALVALHKMMNDPNRIVKGMFKNAEKAIQSGRLNRLPTKVPVKTGSILDALFPQPGKESPRGVINTIIDKAKNLPQPGMSIQDVSKKIDPTMGKIANIDPEKLIPEIESSTTGMLKQYGKEPIDKTGFIPSTQVSHIASDIEGKIKILGGKIDDGLIQKHLEGNQYSSLSQIKDDVMKLVDNKNNISTMTSPNKIIDKFSEKSIKPRCVNSFINKYNVDNTIQPILGQNDSTIENAVKKYESNLKQGNQKILFGFDHVNGLKDGKIIETLPEVNNAGMKFFSEDEIKKFIQNRDNKIIPTNTILSKPVYKESGPLTTKLLKKLEGKSETSRQYIFDLTNSGDLKQQERDLIREVLDRQKGDKIDVNKFAEDVKTELLPLKVKTSSYEKTVDGFNRPKNDGYTPRYENISLPEEVRGNVANYSEHIYESPIKTSAGNTHFSGSTEKYFGHTRVEDLGTSKESFWFVRGNEVIDTSVKGGKTIKKFKTKEEAEAFIRSQGKIRRVIEVQSDLYQKGNLERETSQAKSILKNDGYGGITSNDNDTRKFIKNEAQNRINEAKKLEQYNNPTAHFRMAREEVAQAAKDGKTKIQFPTGETAMKIEGLGSDSNEWNMLDEFEEWNTINNIDELEVGKTVSRYGDEGDVIITDVLEDGKFKAVPRDSVASSYKDLSSIPDSYKETFDISGKVDTSNPIYKFYEKDLGKYLKNKYNSQVITDNRGVTWHEIDIKPEHKGPIEAFGVVPTIIGAKSYQEKKKKQTILDKKSTG